MTSKNKLGPVAVVPGPGNFNFSAYLSGQSTFPTFKHTVYLDQATGVELLRVCEKYEELATRGREIERKQDQNANSGARSLVDESAEALADELEEVQRKTDPLAAQIRELEEKVKQSGLTLHFQVGTAQKLGSVIRRSEKEFTKKHGRGDADDVEYLTNKSRHILIAQLDAYCTGLELPDGSQQESPDKAGFGDLLETLIPSESVRLLTALNENLDASSEWADRIDAGFPGRGDDVGGEPVGAGDSEVGQAVGGSAADHADRGEDDLA